MIIDVDKGEENSTELIKVSLVFKISSTIVLLLCVRIENGNVVNTSDVITLAEIFISAVASSIIEVRATVDISLGRTYAVVNGVRVPVNDPLLMDVCTSEVMFVV